MRVAEALAGQIVAHGGGKAKDKGIYVYAIQNMAYTCLTWGVLLLAGLLLGKLLFCIAFLACYVPLRIYAGGFHQSTRLRCFATSLLLFALFLGVIGLYDAQHPLWVDAAMLLACGAIVFGLSPVEDCHKPLSAGEKKHSRKMARVIFLVEATVVLLLKLMFHSSLLSFSMLLAVCAVSILVLLGYGKNKRLTMTET